jgi:hypothetical protein
MTLGQSEFELQIRDTGDHRDGMGRGLHVVIMGAR